MDRTQTQPPEPATLLGHPQGDSTVNVPAPVSMPTFGDTFRRFIQILAVLFCLFLVVRTCLLEPFGVPTGSMANTLYGFHRDAPCPRCGYPIRVGSPPPEERRGHQFRSETHAFCPNCGQAPINLTELSPILPGDRLLVDKTAFLLRRPKRWEIAVFHCPVDEQKPYVKRVAGLPGEDIQIWDGDLYVNHQLARKTLPQIRQTRIVCMDMDYVPEKYGWADRWRLEPIAPVPERRPGERASVAPTASILANDHLILNTLQEQLGLSYRNWNFDTEREEFLQDQLDYNGGYQRGQEALCHDFCVEFDLEVLAGDGSVALRLGDGSDFIQAVLPVRSGAQSAVVSLATEDQKQSQRGSCALVPKRTYHVEFAFVDRSAYLAVDGVEVVSPLLLAPPPKKNAMGHGDPMPTPAGIRPGVQRPLQLGAQGVHVVLRHLRLYRDIHYRSEGIHANKEEYRLAADEYFMLGDNSSSSRDSREWEIPGVPEQALIGKPFMIHQPQRIGRITVNGRERQLQLIDWSRLRILDWSE